MLGPRVCAILPSIAELTWSAPASSPSSKESFTTTWNWVTRLFSTTPSNSLTHTDWMLRIVREARSTVCRTASSKLSEDRPDSSMNFTTDIIGSVRAGANQYRLCWDEANPGSCGLQNGQHGRGPPEVEQPASVGGNMLVVAGAEAEEVAQFVVSPAEPGGRSGAFEAPHGSIAAFDAAVILLQPVVQVGAGPVLHIFAEFGPDRPGVAVVTRSGVMPVTALADRKNAWV